MQVLGLYVVFPNFGVTTKLSINLIHSARYSERTSGHLSIAKTHSIMPFFIGLTEMISLAGGLSHLIGWGKGAMM